MDRKSATTKNSFNGAEHRTRHWTLADMANHVALEHKEVSGPYTCWICGQKAHYSESLGRRHKSRYLCAYHWHLTYGDTSDPIPTCGAQQQQDRKGPRETKEQNA